MSNVFQDKSSCIGPQCVRNLLPQGGDVLLVNVGSGVSAAHLASLTRDSHPNIYAFGVRSDKHGEQVAYNFKKFDVPSMSNCKINPCVFPILSLG